MISKPKKFSPESPVNLYSWWQKKQRCFVVRFIRDCIKW